MTFQCRFIFKKFGITFWIIRDGKERGLRRRSRRVSPPRGMTLPRNPNLSNLTIRAGARTKAAARIPAQIKQNLTWKKGVVKHKNHNIVRFRSEIPYRWGGVPDRISPLFWPGLRWPVRSGGCWGGWLSVNVACDQPGATLIGEISPSPLEENNEPVSESDQKKDVHKQPGEPGKVS